MPCTCFCARQAARQNPYHHIAPQCAIAHPAITHVHQDLGLGLSVLTYIKRPNGGLRIDSKVGTFTYVDGPLLINNAPGKVFQYSGIPPNTTAEDVASFIESADATNALFVVTTPDGLRAQDSFASSTAVQ